MTDKAQKILQKMQKRQALKRWREFSNPERREKILHEFNRAQMDDVGPLGGDQGMTVLKDINDLGQRQEQIIRESFAKVSVY